MAKVVLDPGHGGKDPGARGNPAVEPDEADVVLQISLAAKRFLEERGVTVILTRDRDVFVPLGQRAAVANRTGADLFVSVHINSAADPRTNYYSTWIHPGAAERTREAARTIHAALLRATGLPDGGIREANFAVLRETRMPAVLLECGFISNPEMEARMRDHGWCRRVAEGIAAGVAASLGVPTTTRPAGTDELVLEIDGKVIPARARLEGGIARGDLRPVLEAAGYAVTYVNGRVVARRNA